MELRLTRTGKNAEKIVRERIKKETKAKKKNAATLKKIRYMVGGRRRTGKALGACAVFFSLWAGDLSASLQKFLLMVTKTSMEDWIFHVSFPLPFIFSFLLSLCIQDRGFFLLLVLHHSALCICSQ